MPSKWCTRGTRNYRLASVLAKLCRGARKKFQLYRESAQLTTSFMEWSRSGTRIYMNRSWTSSWMQPGNLMDGLVDIDQPEKLVTKIAIASRLHIIYFRYPHVFGIREIITWALIVVLSNVSLMFVKYRDYFELYPPVCRSILYSCWTFLSP